MSAGRVATDILPTPGAKPEDVEPGLKETVALWRLHWEPDKTFLDLGPRTPKWRFDDPKEEYAVTYANAEQHGPFIEVYGETGRIGRGERRRRLSLVRSARPLLLLDVDNPKTQKAFRLDARINTSKQYTTTRAWGRAWHDWYENLDGIRYLSREASDTLNYCLFLDRCRADLLANRLGSLGRMDRRLILGLIDGYGITLEF